MSQARPRPTAAGSEFSPKVPPPASGRDPRKLIYWPVVLGSLALAGAGVSGLVAYLSFHAGLRAARSSPVDRPVVVVTLPPAAPAEVPAPARTPPQTRVSAPAKPASATPKDSAPPPVKPPERSAEAVQAVAPPALSPKPQGTAPRALKRRDLLSPDDLCRQLLLAREIDVDSVPGTSERILIASRTQENPALHLVPQLLATRPDIAGLPMRMGLDCQLSKESAENLEALSKTLRSYLSEAKRTNGLDTRHDPAVLRLRLLGEADAAHAEWLQPETIPALVQILQAEEKPLRLLLVEVLGKIPGRAATIALAQRALFDVSETVREMAVTTLRSRPRDESRPVFLQAFRYPWAPVMDHAAEALVMLDDRDAVPQLVELLGERDPRLPATPDRTWSKPVVRELVRINHFRNCLLCHAASFNTNELVRAPVPSPGQALLSNTSYYSDHSLTTFVHADTTYLRSDFSVPQPVARPGPWPVYQRYDYVVRTRPATDADLALAARQPAPTAHQEAIEFALRELTGANPGSSQRDWQRWLAKATSPN